MSKLQLAIRIPWSGRIDRADVLEIARIADDAGYHSGWVGDHVVYPMSTESRNPSVPGDGRYPESVMAAPTHEAFTSLAFVAAATERLQLGVGCCVLPQRQPLVVAKQAATIDRLSGGRMILGVVAGWLEEEFDALDAPHARRGARMEEGIRLIRECYESEHPAHEGDNWQFPPLRFEPKPERNPFPIWLGGHSMLSLRRAVELGDGWCGSVQAADDARHHAETLRALRADSPRRDIPFTVFVSVPHVPGDPEFDLSGTKLRDVMDAHEDAGVDVLLLDDRTGDSGEIVKLAQLGAVTLR